MERRMGYTASTFDLSRTRNILNANMNQIGMISSAMTKQPYTPEELHSPESGPSQQRSNIIRDMEAEINKMPLPIPYAKSESQSSFDQNAQVLDISASNESLFNMEDGEEEIIFVEETPEAGTGAEVE